MRWIFGCTECDNEQAVDPDTLTPSMDGERVTHAYLPCACAPDEHGGLDLTRHDYLGFEL